LTGPNILLPRSLSWLPIMTGSRGKTFPRTVVTGGAAFIRSLTEKLDAICAAPSGAVEIILGGRDWQPTKGAA